MTSYEWIKQIVCNSTNLYLLAKDSELLISSRAPISIRFYLLFAEDHFFARLLLWRFRRLSVLVWRVSGVLLLRLLLGLQGGHRGPLLHFIGCGDSSIVTLQSLLMLRRHRCLIWNVGEGLLVHQLVRNARCLRLVLLQRCLYIAFDCWML